MLSFRKEDEIKTFPNKQELGGIITIEIALLQMLKGILQAEIKGC